MLPAGNQRHIVRAGRHNSCTEVGCGSCGSRRPTNRYPHITVVIVIVIVVGFFAETPGSLQHRRAYYTQHSTATYAHATSNILTSSSD